MLQKMTLRRLIVMLTGRLFAIYAAYNIFIVVRNGNILPTEGVVISVIVALMFSLLAFFTLTYGVRNPRFLLIRKIIFIVALLTVFVLKLRMADQVIAYLDIDELHTILYGGSYFLTQLALLLLIVCFTLQIKNPKRYPRATAVLSAIAMILFLLSFLMEVILFFGSGIGLEASRLRTVVIRPIFYFGFVGLCLYFLYPPQLTES